MLVKSPYGEWRPHISMPRPLLCHELLGHAIFEFARRGLNPDLEWFLLYRTEDGQSVRCTSGAVVEPWGTYILATTMEYRAEGASDE